MNAESRKTLDLFGRTYTDESGTYQFWALAPANQKARRQAGVKAAGTEFVWLVDSSRLTHYALVSLDDSRILHRSVGSVF